MSDNTSATGEMIRFDCRVRSRQSPEDLETITVVAEDKEQALSKLHRDGYLVISIHESHEGRGSSKKSGLDLKAFKARRNFLSAFNTVTTRELIFFAMQLSTLLKAGVALLRALEILERGTANMMLAGVIKKMAKTVSEGRSLGEALREHPKVFPWLWTNLVEVGEMSGTLPEVLIEVSRYQEASEKIKGKVVSALFYPGILMTIAGAAVTFLLIFIVPKFAEIFKSQNMQLPVLTQMIVAVSYVIKNYAIFVVGFIAIIIYLIKLYASTPLGKISIGGFFLKAPLFGGFILEVSVVRFSRSLATLLHAGLPLIKSLETAAKLTGNAFLEKRILEAREAVTQGHGLGVQLESKKVFPIFMAQLISVGEETGEIESFLKMLSNYYEERVDQFLSRISVVIEPIMLVFMAAVIGTIVIGMFLPIVELSTGAH